jgi:hypothetical protein
MLYYQRLGTKVSASYKKKYGKKPEKGERFVAGTTRPVYEKKDWDLVENAIKQYYKVPTLYT